MKKLLFLVAVFLLAGGGILVWYNRPDMSQQGAHEHTPVYTSDEAGLMFQYVDLYKLEERHDGFDGKEVHVLTLVDASSTVPNMSEGPTAISVIEIPIVATTSLADWVRNNSISNFYMSPDKMFSSTTVGGEGALVYRYSGLYESDAVAVAHGGKIYLFAASWIDANDRIRTDFKNLISSVRFIP